MPDKWTRLTELREQRNMSQQDLAKALGISRSSLSMYEVGQREPDHTILKRIAKFFGVTTDYLLQHEAEPFDTEHVPPEWKQVIATCRTMGLGPTQVVKALQGIDVITRAVAEATADKKE